VKQFLHVGCGPQHKTNLKGFNTDNWKEIRFDIDSSVNPDIQGTLTDMKDVKNASMDAIYSSHNIEHIFPHEVPIALKEFHRILVDDGMVVITCPDLQSVCEAVAKDKLLDSLYTSPSGPISAIDILYGHRGYIAQGNIYMAHKCGFTYSALNSAFFDAGFKYTFGGRRPEYYDLWLLGFKYQVSEAKMKNIAETYLP
jgi:SAM-dependent methyltransferase